MIRPNRRRAYVSKLATYHVPRAHHRPAAFSGRAVAVTAACAVILVGLAVLYVWREQGPDSRDRDDEFFDCQSNSFIGADGAGTHRGGTR